MSYVLRTGMRGASRLEVLGRAAEPATEALFDRVGVQPGWRCLDAGCGIGLVSRALRARGARVVGLERDPGFAALNEECRVGSLDTVSPVPEFDLVYARYLLSHLEDPLSGLKRLTGWLKPGGRLVVEDVDFPGHYCHPPSPAFVRYLELYQTVSASPCVGRRLGELAGNIGCQVLHLGVSVALHEPRVAELTLAQIAPAVLGRGLETRAGLARLVRELRAHRRAGALMSLAPTFQLIASASP